MQYKITPKKALEIIEQVRQMVSLPGKDHDMLKEAVEVLKSLVNK